jgi:PPOX class probable F420-dependent enzyme
MSYEFKTMGAEEIDAFLNVTRHAVMGTNRIDGSPQLSPVWYLYREGKFYTSVGDRSAKCINLRRDNRVTLCVDGVYPDARYIVIYGTVEIESGQSEWREDTEKAIAYRYHDSSEEAERYLSEVSRYGSVMLIVSPQKILSGNYN